MENRQGSSYAARFCAFRLERAGEASSSPSLLLPFCSPLFSNPSKVNPSFVAGGTDVPPIEDCGVGGCGCGMAVGL